MVFAAFHVGKIAGTVAGGWWLAAQDAARVAALLTEIGRPLAQDFFQLGRICRRCTDAVSGSAARTEGDNLGIRIRNGGKGKQGDDHQASQHVQQALVAQAINGQLLVFCETGYNHGEGTSRRRMTGRAKKRRSFEMAANGETTD
jgi:hypothetical protein